MHGLLRQLSDSAGKLNRRLRTRPEELQDEFDLKENLIYVIRGMAKGFLVYAVPISLLSRKPAGVRRGMVLAIFVGVVRALDRILQYLKARKHIFGRYAAKLPLHALAGAISAYVAVKIDPSLKKSTFVFWVLVRAVRSVAPPIPGAATLVMVLSAAQILSTWTIAKDEIPKPYRKFLDRQGGKPHEVLKQLFHEGPIDFAAVVHPGQSLLGHGVQFFFQGLLRALPVYAPLYALFFLFSRKRSPTHYLRNVLQSSAFLSLYCTLAWTCAGVYFGITKYLSRPGLFLSTAPAGLATLVERPSRRPELAAYCATYALDITYRYLRKRGYTANIPALHGLAIVLAAAVIMHNHDQQPRVVMKWLFGIR